MALPHGGRHALRQQARAAMAPATLSRVDRTGAPLSLLERAPERPAVLFYGRPGMGSSFELDRSVAAAHVNGWTVLQVDGSPTDPIELRFSQAISRYLLPVVREEHGRAAVKELKELMRGLALRLETEHKAHEGRVTSPSLAGAAPTFSYAFRAGKDSIGGDPGSTLSDLADVLSRLGRPVLLAVDNVADGADTDLAHLNDLARHLSRGQLPVNLVLSGGPQALKRLESAASPHLDGVQTNIRGLYDVRECLPLSGAQLSELFRQEMGQSRTSWSAEAEQLLVTSAYGNPQRMRMLAHAAAGMANPAIGVERDVAGAAVEWVNRKVAPYHEAEWTRSDWREQYLMGQAVMQGDQDVDLAGIMANTQPWMRPDVAMAYEDLIRRGVITREGQASGQVQFADPGMRNWVQTYGVQAAQYLAAAYPGVPPLQSVRPPQQAAAAQPSAAPGLRARLPRDLTSRMPGGPDPAGHFPAGPGVGY